MSKEWKKRIHTLILAVACCVFVVSGGKILYSVYQQYKEESRFGELRTSVAMNDQQLQELENEPALTQEEKHQKVVDYQIEQYRALNAENSDLVGWGQIDVTHVDYPVMYSPTYHENYLRRDFDGNYAYGGTPFIEENCSVEKPSANLIIYGHNGPGDTMFADLKNYRDEAYYQEHKYIQFNTLDKLQTYEVLAFFPSQVYTQEDNVFKYYYFYDAQSAEQFDYYVRNVKALSYYDTGVEATFGDELITLSTCDESRTEGRYVLVAKKISEEAASTPMVKE